MRKKKINIKKHKINFTTASFVFDDRNRIEFYDDIHSSNEDRYLTIGLVNDIAVILLVVYTERRDKIRLISARKANSHERRMYYDNFQRN